MRRSTSSILALMLLLSSCETITALSFKPATGSGTVGNQDVKVSYLTNRPGTDSQLSDPGLDKLAPPELKSAISPCLPSQPAIGVAAIPLVAAGGQFLFQVATDALAIKVKEIRDRAQRTYDGQVTVDVPILQKDAAIECILLTRTTVDPQTKLPMNLGLAVLFRKLIHGDGLTLEPVYVHLANSVAETASTDTPRLNLAVAVVVKGLLEEKTSPLSERKLLAAPVAEATFKFQGIPLGGKPLICLNVGKCAGESAILAPLSTTKSGATITVAVTETGSGYGDIDAALGEIKALQAALGPAVNASIKTYLERSLPTDSP